MATTSTLSARSPASSASTSSSAIEMEELPACDLPGAVRGEGDQGVAAGVIADRSRIGRGVRDGTIHAEIQARDDVGVGALPPLFNERYWPHA